MNHPQTENKMGTMPVNKLLLQVSTPLMIAMIVQGLYNVVDSIFVSQISENALTAVTLSFPIQLLMIAGSVGLGVGINATISKSLGEKNLKKASDFAVNGLFISTIGGILCLIFGLFFVRDFMEGQTDVSEIVESGTTYLSICATCGFAVFYQVTFERLLQSTGRSNLTLISLGCGAICNLILDPILIFGLFGVPAMGIAGAAVATVSGQILGFSLGVYLNHYKNHEINVELRGFRPNGAIIKEIMRIATPAIVMQAIGSVMSYAMNLILLGFATTATAVFGIYYRLQNMVMMPIYGMMNGMVPIIGYNFGACRPDRIRKTFWLATIYAVAIGAVGALFMLLMPDILLNVFKAEPYMMSIGVPALRILSGVCVLAAFNISATSAFQALGKSGYSLLASVIRQLLLLIPLAYLASLTGILNLVWWSYAVADVFCIIACILLLKKVEKTVIKPMEDVIS